MRKYYKSNDPAGFWARVDSSHGPDSCWPWIHCLDKDGYGTLGKRSPSTKTHRVAWILTYGPIPPGKCVLHRCDNRSCCNPHHLFIGTQDENMMDMAKKERSASTKLTGEQVKIIRKQFAEGSISQHQLAKQYGLCTQTVWEIIHRHIWKHIS